MSSLICGLIILLCSVTKLLPNDTINTIIIFYSFGIPFSLLGFSTIIDLNDNRVISLWLIYSIILLLISFITKDSSQFSIHRSNQFDYNSRINSLMNDRSTAALKSLFIFLIVYWILNQFSKRIKGHFIINTFRQPTWKNEEAKRKMTSMDVFCNIILYVTIICSVLF